VSRTIFQWTTLFNRRFAADSVQQSRHRLIAGIALHRQQQGVDARADRYRLGGGANAA